MCAASRSLEVPRSGESKEGLGIDEPIEQTWRPTSGWNSRVDGKSPLVSRTLDPLDPGHCRRTNNQHGDRAERPHKVRRMANVSMRRPTDALAPHPGETRVVQAPARERHTQVCGRQGGGSEHAVGAPGKPPRKPSQGLVVELARRKARESLHLIGRHPRVCAGEPRQDCAARGIAESVENLVELCRHIFTHMGEYRVAGKCRQCFFAGQGYRSISMLTGQWSLPITSAWIFAFFTFFLSASDTRT